MTGESVSGKLVVIGGGQAAFALVAKLRALKDERPITIVASEASLPYQRPPLSKKYLLREMSLDRLLYRAEAWYGEHDVDIRLSTTVTDLDRDASRVMLSDGTSLDYETLAFATGATPRRLPASVGGDLDGVFTVRDFRDADLLAEEMKPGRRALVVGGGYIGLEAAAVARTLGLEVTVIEMADRILQRVASAATSGIVREIHRSRGVDIREGTGLNRLVGENGRVTGVELSDGSVLPVDLVIVGIGVTANDHLAHDAGLETAGGIVVDSHGRTSDPAIFAMGDCAVQPWGNMRIRLESVQNAVDQAEAVAAVIAGGVEPYAPKPWFWSDQYDVKLQIAGFGLGHDETIVRPGQREGSVSVWYFREGKLLAVDAINDAKAYVTGKKLLETGIHPDRAVIADPQSDLKALLAQA
ncbi:MULTISPECIES: FAD-dependent oxidoreductase [Ensifer]|jgi:3-phenylpropionate/trans-cinnamate dioxygenase ferredoxin reductase component|uniref:NAD(P)/FAD-dependent oxidoreductase n=1 Tax=Ensifer TaxID=106591 RepID=UPI00056FE9FD|nr:MULTISPECIES: FAD-dependent oxidoreductase [Ensifer]KQU71732.1 pyridine nucleotide-disulfide oxidoreductase [Ensifer sp. Root31]KQW62640.1 pyridine nucleotide-disulfide oxidoreductase [Ensifer sp. Root1252]KQY71525.1 pyridine nucleotide-disulfide oxidoreductase [Ensifer sp. Root142]KRC83460.1 pyridine nucleotide-disulfide oxidoreductase [Ensifer sp. Root231]KRC86634.1 pyridine nucleotide-disulfide oxidoreductase [Ensifer sp. Root258]